MLVNQYRMTSVITGEVITGTRSQLMERGIDADAVKLVANSIHLLDQEWKCEMIGKIERPKKEDGRKKPKVSIDEIALMAQKAGMHYGEYVAVHNL